MSLLDGCRVLYPGTHVKVEGNASMWLLHCRRTGKGNTGFGISPEAQSLTISHSSWEILGKLLGVGITSQKI